MQDKPRLLDLFCGAGGAAMGYYRAGFDVVGVDIKPQSHYPFAFHQADALEYCAEHGREFDAIHASPPCQHYSWSAARWGKNNYPDLVDKTRKLLIDISIPYIIENVIGAPLNTVIELCGSMFGLMVFKHRRFETSHLIFQPYHKSHTSKIGFSDGDFVTTAGHGGDGSGQLNKWMKALDINWMDKTEMAQAIPPAYTEFIGKQLMRHLNAG